MEENMILPSEQPSEEKEDLESRRKRTRKEVFDWVKTILLALVLVVILRNFVFFVAQVDGQSMEPTLDHNDRLIVWRLGYTPQSGDIVIFSPPVEIDAGKHWIKRVIATEGQTVRIDYATNSVYVDGERLDEDYLGEIMLPAGIIDEVTVPEGRVFVLGDNRNNSTDSRFIGCITTDSILGKAVVRIWPLDSLGTFGD